MMWNCRIKFVPALRIRKPTLAPDAEKEALCLRTVFMGTPDFAVPCLQGLIDEGHEVAAVFTQPDKPKGRGYTLAPPPVKVLALSHDIPVYQPKTLKNGEAFALLKELAPELIVVVAYGKLLPGVILTLPRHGCINVHASLLPQYRGAAPIQWSVLRGEEKTGVTTMFMDEGLDTGDMLLREETAIGPDETAGEVHDRLALLGAGLLIRTLEQLEAGTLVRTPQPEGTDVFYASMLDKSLCGIDWNKPAQTVHNLVRGLNPWPTASTKWQGKTLKIHRTRLLGEATGAPGEILSLHPLTVCCGDGRALELCEVQYEGGKRMAAADFLRGHPISLPAAIGGKPNE